MTDLEFLKGLRETFQSPTGKAVLKHLEEVYVDTSAFDKSPELTYARLRVKEFVQGLVKDALSTDDLKPITVFRPEE